MRLVLIPSGVFERHSLDLREASDSTTAVESIVVAKPFRMSEAEITQSQYLAVMGNNPSRFVGDQRPVEQVSWEDAREFCRRLSGLESEMASGRRYRLPTETEWEYACRADMQAPYGFGDQEELLGEYARFAELSGGTIEVKQKQPNAWGLYDMHGNVAEWCLDVAGDDREAGSNNPRDSNSGRERIARGGYWFAASKGCRCDYRDAYEPNSRLDELGFRVVVEMEY